MTHTFLIISQGQTANEAELDNVTYLLLTENLQVTWVAASCSILGYSVTESMEEQVIPDNNL